MQEEAAAAALIQRRAPARAPPPMVASSFEGGGLEGLLAGAKSNVSRPKSRLEQMKEAAEKASAPPPQMCLIGPL
eukprot:714409-Prorocentrum_minimum.AAC.3